MACCQKSSWHREGAPRSWRLGDKDGVEGDTGLFRTYRMHRRPCPGCVCVCLLFLCVEQAHLHAPAPPIAGVASQAVALPCFRDEVADTCAGYCQANSSIASPRPHKALVAEGAGAPC